MLRFPKCLTGHPTGMRERCRRDRWHQGWRCWHYVSRSIA